MLLMRSEKLYNCMKCTIIENTIVKTYITLHTYIMHWKKNDNAIPPEHAKSYDLCPADEGHDQAVPQPPHHPQSPCQDWGRHHGKDPIPWPGKSGRVELGLNLNGIGNLE